jgi:hypothetical protein
VETPALNVKPNEAVEELIVLLIKILFPAVKPNEPEDELV